VRLQRPPGTALGCLSALGGLLRQFSPGGVDSARSNLSPDNRYQERAYPLDKVNTPWSYHGVAWAIPQSSRAEVDTAGDVLIDDSLPSDALERVAALDSALAVINNWRSSHSFPLNTLQMYLRGQAKKVDSRCLVAQRIKRLSSIELKLRRFSWLKLSEMQDIGGCRAVVKSVRQVYGLVRLYKRSDIKHKLVDEDDYIRNPKRSGYRGYHLIYRYHSDRNETYNDLKVEIQLRSRLQHAWATAVEIVGHIVHQALKASRGEQDWLQFFALMGNAIALRERTIAMPNMPTGDELRKELRKYVNRLGVEGYLGAANIAYSAPSQLGIENAHYFLLELDFAARTIQVRGYPKNELEKASSDYLTIERSIADKPADAVLVSVESVRALRRAYPNYFLDAGVFMEAVRKAIS
jgi:hypothetical protein